MSKGLFKRLRGNAFLVGTSRRDVPARVTAGGTNGDRNANDSSHGAAVARRGRRSAPSLPGIAKILLLLIGCFFAAPTFAQDSTAGFEHWMNIGAAYLENRNSAQATEAFSQAIDLDPNSPAAHRNLARACYLAERNAEARSHLEKAGQLEESAGTHYLLGILDMRELKFDEAIPHFEKAIQQNPQIAAVHFQLANACQLAGRHEQARRELKETIKLDPLHASAHFKLAAYARQSGDMDEYQRQQQEFRKLRLLFGDSSRTPAALERCVYTQPESSPPENAFQNPPIPVSFTDDSETVFGTEELRQAATITVLEVAENGACVFLTIDPDGKGALLEMSAEGKFERTLVEADFGTGLTFGQSVAADFGDDVPEGVKYDPAIHGLTDVLLVGDLGVRLFKRTSREAFENDTANLPAPRLLAPHAQWIDYDHDGDLDILIAAGEEGIRLFQNNGNDTFADVTSEGGLADAGTIVDVAAADFNIDGAIDLVAGGVPLGGAPERSVLYRNLRTGRFEKDSLSLPTAARVLADDFNNDGFPDMVLAFQKEATFVSGKRPDARTTIPLENVQFTTLIATDYDNDGWLDLCVAGNREDNPRQGAIQLWRNSGDGQWTDASDTTELAGLDLPPIQNVIAADADGDGDSDLLVVSSDEKLHFLRNEGGNRNHQLKIKLVGTKTNPSGIGTRIELRSEGKRIVRSISRLPIEIGYGQAERLDALKTIWTNGIIDNEIDMVPGQGLVQILEKNVAAGSCPYLYAWDGNEFRFVTDILGNSPLGLSVSRDQVLPADPDEFVLIGDSDEFRPRDGKYEIQVTEELREVAYLDELRLVAVDHPPDQEIHSTDKLGPPPFGTSELWALEQKQLPAKVCFQNGGDITAAVSAIDDVFAPTGVPLPPPLRGQCHPYSILIEFEKPIDAQSAVLALTGWLQYGDASVNIAASQNDTLKVIPPRLEAEDANGAWQPVDVVVGMPAGKTKTILCDLSGKLPPQSRRLRLTTTFEIHWDRIALFSRVSLARNQRHELRPDEARLYWRGFSEMKVRSPDAPPTPRFGKVSDRPPWHTTPQGWHTRYGDVLALVAERDDRLALFNGGDALRARFDAASLPPLPNGWKRTFFFYSVGWDKDADYNVIAGDRANPSPVIQDPSWDLKYNTRWVPEDRFAE